MYININELLIEKSKTLSWLAIETDCNYSTLWLLSHNRKRSINIEIIEKVCHALECGVEDILLLEGKW